MKRVLNVAQWIILGAACGLGVGLALNGDLSDAAGAGAAIGILLCVLNGLRDQRAV